MSVKTYDWGFAEMEERGDGDYVLFTDYESLQRERDALREALQQSLQSMLDSGYRDSSVVIRACRAALTKGAYQ